MADVTAGTAHVGTPRGDLAEAHMIRFARLSTYPQIGRMGITARPGGQVRWDNLPACKRGTIAFLDLTGCALIFVDVGPVPQGGSVACDVPTGSEIHV